jgi:dTDP-4-amino-4,6-dideoxygalactose transaminase
LDEGQRIVLDRAPEVAGTYGEELHNKDHGDISMFRVAMNPEAADAVAKTLNSGFIGQGPRVEEFEAKLGSRLQTPYVLSVNSCTSAIHLAFHLIRTGGSGLFGPEFPDVSDGDEVLTSALTCTATNWPALAERLALKWVDVDPSTLNIDLLDAEAKLTPKTKVLLFVHWGGYPVDLDAVKALQDRCFARFGFKPYVIEDCAHSWGASWRGRPLGSDGHFAVFSFQAIKHLTCGDGGALVCPNSAAYDRGKLVRWFGIDREQRNGFRAEGNIEHYGFKFHMNDINATIGLSNLGFVPPLMQRHRDNSAFYDDALRDIPGVQQLQRKTCERTSACWLYSLMVEDLSGFTKKMLENGISVSQVHSRNDRHSCVSAFQSALPVLDSIEDRYICIPVGWWVGDSEREYIVDVIRSGW